MTPFEVLVAIYVAVIPPALGALFWARFSRLESRIDILETNLRSEFREELRAVRADLTQVALVVGARPRASEA